MAWGRKPGDEPEKPEKIAVPSLLDGDREKSEEGLSPLTDRLGSIGQLLDETKGEVIDFLARRDQESTGSGLAALSEKIDQLASRLAQAPAGGDDGSNGGSMNMQLFGAMLQPLVDKISSLEKAMGSGAPSLSAAADSPATAPASPGIDAEAMADIIRPVQEGLAEQVGAINGAIEQMQQQTYNNISSVYQRLEGGLGEILGILKPAIPEEDSNQAPAGYDEWAGALIGYELAQQQEIHWHVRQLLDGVISGDDAMRTFVGNLLIFRSAATDRMPPLLKDLGEAFYRWQVKTDHQPVAMEEVLVKWVNETCNNAGIGNVVEVVHPGERFDSQRHNATNRGGGVEISRVLGWVVLRDNGKVYTKAATEVV